MNKKRSEAAIAGLLDDISASGISPIDDEILTIDSSSKETVTPPQFPVQAPANKEMVISIATNRCRPWDLADRIKEEMGDIEELANSIKSSGQQEPALARKLAKRAGDVEFEIIFGHRRWKACQLIGLPLKIIVKDLTDQEAAISQKEENENRMGISEYSRAQYYKKLLDKKLFKSISELAANMNTSKTNIVDLLSFTRIDPKIIAAMVLPHKLTKKSAIKLSLLSKNAKEETINALIYLAPDIATGKIPSSKIEAKLREQLSGAIVQEKYSKTFKSATGTDLFTSRRDSNGSPILVFHKLVRENIEINDIEQLINDFLATHIGDSTS